MVASCSCCFRFAASIWACSSLCCRDCFSLSAADLSLAADTAASASSLCARIWFLILRLSSLSSSMCFCSKRAIWDILYKLVIILRTSWFAIAFAKRTSEIFDWMKTFVQLYKKKLSWNSKLKIVSNYSSSSRVKRIHLKLPLHKLPSRSNAIPPCWVIVHCKLPSPPPAICQAD